MHLYLPIKNGNLSLKLNIIIITEKNKPYHIYGLFKFNYYSINVKCYVQNIVVRTFVCYNISGYI